MEKTSQQSLFDVLIQIMPAIQDLKSMLSKRDNPNNSSLYKIWNEASVDGGKKFLKPLNIASSEILKLEKAGLIEDQGKYIKITDKGSDAIKVMILNDNHFNFDKKASFGQVSGWYNILKNKEIES